MSRIALPASRASSSSACTASTAPTSNPRVGEHTTSTRAPLTANSSRASNTFCELPPDSLRVGVNGPGVLISSCLMKYSASVSADLRSTKKPRSRVSTRLSTIESDGAKPVPSRSSGTYARPARRAPSAPPRAVGAPHTVTLPCCGALRPATISARSRWPLPATPATPTISPARTSILMSDRISTPSRSRCTCDTESKTSPVGDLARRGTMLISRPTINSASFFTSA